MAYLVAAVVLVGVLCVLNLLISFGVVRRLREYAARSSGSADVGLPEGATVGPFSARTLDGTAFARDDLTGATVVGFFSTQCRPCHDRLPEFVSYARGAAARTRVVAVVTGPDDAAPTMVPSLAEVAGVVREEFDGGLSRAFAVRGYPAVFALSGTTVTARDTNMLPARA
ncbi:hypothetical protein [Pseudonocardia acaciae]|uniref:hypothetical protein n=1 Tax=Pseudonocardia acaciae TaxID=551276 RepID=UPI00048FA738|nr:hypothetical protein [Pseudonocardia acaciae]